MSVSGTGYPVSVKEPVFQEFTVPWAGSEGTEAQTMGVGRGAGPQERRCPYGLQGQV